MKTLGKQIVVVDNSFVYVGDCYWEKDFLRIEGARNIRSWGTTKGLGELVNGPTAKTIHDPCGICLVPTGRVVLFLEVVKGW